MTMISISSSEKKSFQAGLLLTHHDAHVSVEVIGGFEVRFLPRYVDGLDSVVFGMLTEGVDKSLDGTFNPLDVIVVNVHVVAVVVVLLANPLTEGVFLMFYEVAV